jgi:hypothetical protein
VGRSKEKVKGPCPRYQKLTSGAKARIHFATYRPD